MNRFRPVPMLFAAAVLASGLAATATKADSAAPTVVELFTSQGCYSCPPAEAFLRDLADQKTVLALEFHVDYWDELVYGAAGKWKDVYSKHEFTVRQAGYNQRIKGRGNVYTPQMVIGGQLEAVGSQRLAVLSAIRSIEAARVGRIGVEVTGAGSGATRVSLRAGGGNPVPGQAAVWLVRFLREGATEVRSGENKGKTLHNRNVVTGLTRIGDWRGRDVAIDVPDFRLKVGEGCAVLVQDDRWGPILGAAACPAPSG
jgi:hypothetical protein